MTLCNYFLWFLFYSLFGWAYESILCSILEKRPVNRGFLNGPICPIYGSGAILFLTVLPPLLNNPILIFFAGMISASVLEYFTSWALEKMFHARWWEYDNFFLNIHGRVCLLAGAVFGGFAVILIEWVQPWIEPLTNRIPERTRWLLAILLLVILLADCVVTFLNLAHFTQKLSEIQAAFNHIFRDARTQAGNVRASTEETTERSRSYPERIKNLLQNRTFQEKRILQAFPKMDSDSFNEALQRVKQWWRSGGKQKEEEPSDSAIDKTKKK